MDENPRPLHQFAALLLAVTIVAAAIWPLSTPTAEGYPGDHGLSILLGDTNAAPSDSLSANNGAAPAVNATATAAAAQAATATQNAAAAQMASAAAAAPTSTATTTSVAGNTPSVAETATAAAATSTAAALVTAIMAAGQTAIAATATVAAGQTAIAATAITAAMQTSTAAPLATATAAAGQTATAIAAPTATYIAGLVATAIQLSAQQTSTAAPLATGTAVAALTQTAVASITPTDTPTSYYGTAEPTWTSGPTSTPTATLVPPANDDFNSATEVGTLRYTNSENTAGATVASDDPSMGNNSGQNSATVWYRFTSSASGGIRVDTSGSDYDTVLAAFTGNRGSLSQVASNDDFGGTRQSQITFSVQPGTTYYIEVGGFGSSTGGQLHLAVDYSSGTITVTPGTVTPGTATPGAVVPSTTPTVQAATSEASTIPFNPVQPIASSSDPRYFQSTGFRIDRDSFWDYFQKRGGVSGFGYPISREFTFSGFQVQLFQRGMLQQKPDGNVTTVNLLDEGIMPYTQINSSTFPAVEKAMKDSAPSPADPNYAENALAFIDANVPDQWNGQQVGFHQAFASRVKFEDAFPLGDGEPALIPLMDLEMWGLPTSRPAVDPNNHNFVYQRFQRGIMHYDATRGTTEGLLLGDYLKSIMTGQGIPPDLDRQARLSPFYRQYDKSKPGFLSRPADLRGSNLVGAFELDLPQ